MNLGTYAKNLNEGCGTGFWHRLDAERFARGQASRDGRKRTVTCVPTKHRTHELWFVQIEGKES